MVLKAWLSLHMVRVAATFTTLMKAFGSVNIAEPSYAQCRGPRDEAFLATFGEEVYSPEITDIRDTKMPGADRFPHR